MKIISLWGKGEIGKTTVLVDLCKKIQADKRTSEIIVAPNYNNHDIIAVFVFDNKIIGITSYGDNEKVLTEPFQIFRENNCELVFCAGRVKRTNTGSVRYLERLRDEENFELDWVKKDYVEAEVKEIYQKEMDSINNITVNLLYDKL
ncbi:MAG: hypothetical protein IJQ07_06995 [Clostridia bacterium]|nr:hypothetical protein [Clostridia bacterium]